MALPRLRLIRASRNEPDLMHSYARLGVLFKNHLVARINRPSPGALLETPHTY